MATESAIESVTTSNSNESNLYIVNIENSSTGTEVLGVYLSERLGKDAVNKYEKSK